MKKIKFILFFLLLFLSIGCENQNVKVSRQFLEEISSNMANLESYTLEYQMNMKSIGYDILTFQGEADIVKNGNNHLTGTLSMLGMPTSIESYVLKENETIFIYTTMDGGENWTYRIQELTVSEDNNVDMMNQISKAFEKAKKVKSDKDNMDKYEVTIHYEDLGLTNDWMEEININKDADMTINVYVKDNYIVRITADFSDLLKNTMDLKITDYTLVVDVKNINQVREIILPEDIRKQAILAAD